MQQDDPARVRIESMKTHRDTRGALFEPLDDAGLAAQRNVHVVLTQPQEVRGNHVHALATETTTVVGPCQVRLKESGAIRRERRCPRGRPGGSPFRRASCMPIAIPARG